MLNRFDHLVAGGVFKRSSLIAQTLFVVTLGMISSHSAHAAMWTTNSSLLNGRQGHTATLLPNGKVLVAGGTANPNGIDGTNRAELFDPANGTWSASGSMTNGRTRYTATLLLNGKVLVAGGLTTGSPSNLASAELYDPITGTWTLTGALNNALNQGGCLAPPANRSRT